MRRIILFAFISVVMLAGMTPGADAQTTSITYIEIILDCSDSMKREVDGVRKLGAAKAALNNFINESPAGYRFALRIMGGDDNATHYTSNLIAGMGLLSTYSLNEKIQELEAGGERSLYHALNDCLYDFADYNANNVVLLITDGLDEGGQALDDLEFYYENTPGAPRVYVFGLDLTESMVEELNIITKAAGGRVFNLEKPGMLDEVMADSLSEFSGNMSVYLYDADGHPINGDIQIFDISGNPVQAAYNASVLITELPAGIYTVQVKYKGEIKTSDPIDISKAGSGNINFIYKIQAGNVRITLLDMMLDLIKGTIIVRDMANETVFEGGPDNYFSISLPEGAYQVEASAGGRMYLESGVLVTANTRIDIEIIIPVMQSVLEVEINNMQSIPVNARIRIYTMDGFQIGEAEYASYFHITLPPDTYIVEVEARERRYEQTAILYEGDQITLSFDIELRVGYLLIELRTKSGYDAWGTVRVFDEYGRYQRHWSRETDESPDWAFELPEGIYRIEAEVEGIISSRDGVRVEGDQEARIQITFPDWVR